MGKEEMWIKVQNAQTIAIGGHVRPDGDCVGSCMALYQYLTKVFPEKEIDVFFETMPNQFASLFSKVSYQIGFEKARKTYDLFFTLDCGDKERLGDGAKVFENAKDTICIDHHISNVGYAALNFIEPQSSSASEVLYELLDDTKIDSDVATALYLGIAHDTGVFKYSCTSKRTMEIAGALIAKGIDINTLLDQTFYHKSYVQNQILGRVLLESILLLNGKVIASCVTQKIMQFYGATTADLDGIVEQLRVTDGVEMAVLVHELEPLVYKVSMRANDKIDVAAIASRFGGGGHVKAAGCTMTGTYYDIMNTLLELADIQLNEGKAR